ncbi:hypothetical protein F5972_08000 [Microbispora cellulosiformans]|uniref:Uncharacterized protein n=1 Tax=Microbispora cellulosiformans TaxID=2614688 RepID=A0A5J5K642_9ACTN|nr:hypothetical protein [Microbispora cellulosiformans]KAA9379590.1 hypothetical protein F5972_08000 [Microbispora cellulosiformans]
MTVSDRTTEAPAEQAGAAPDDAEPGFGGFGGFDSFGDLDPDDAAMFATLADLPDDDGEGEGGLGGDAPDSPDGDADAQAQDLADGAPEPGPADGEAAATDGQDATPDGEDKPQAPDVKTVKQTAEHLGMLDALHKFIGDELKQAKKDHAPLFAAAANLGGEKQIDLTLPDGTKIGTYNLDQPGVLIAWDTAAVREYTRRTAPHNLYDEVNPAALNYPDIVEFIKLTHPGLVQEAVRPSYLTLLEEQLDEQGRLPDPTTGELVTVAKRNKVDATGEGRFGWTRAKRDVPGGRERLVAAWRAGELRGRIALDPPVAAPAAGADQPPQGGGPEEKGEDGHE